MARNNSRLLGGLLAATITLVAGFEGVTTYAYRDPVNIPTICFGETRNVHMGDTATMAECKQMLGTRLVEFAHAVDGCVHVKVSDLTYESFVSLAYNIGSGAFCSSSVVRKANTGDMTGSCNAILAFNKGRVAGVLVVIPGLDKRRHVERDLCIQGLA